MALKNAARKRRACLTCSHPERARIDFAVASGGTVSAVARKFGVSVSSLHRHAENHISPDYRAVVQSSPLASEEQLRKLAAESGSSVIENLSVIYGALANRWLRAFEIADDAKLAVLTTKMHQNLELRARITKELMPGSTLIQNNFLLGDAAQLLKILSPFPEARKAIVDFYSARSATRQIEHASAAD